jgi:hypothetical protein
MRNFAFDPEPKPGWSVDWLIEDRHRQLPPGSEVHLRYTDLTDDARVSTCEGWINDADPSVTAEAWISRVMVRRQSVAAPLASTFVSVIEPYEKQSNIAHIRRLPLERDGDVAIGITLQDGHRDTILSSDGAPSSRSLNAFDVALDGELWWVRRGPRNDVERIVLCRGRQVRTPGKIATMPIRTDFLEWPSTSKMPI